MGTNAQLTGEASFTSISAASTRHDTRPSIAFNGKRRGSAQTATKPRRPTRQRRRRTGKDIIAEPVMTQDQLAWPAPRRQRIAEIGSRTRVYES